MAENVGLPAESTSSAKSVVSVVLKDDIKPADLPVPSGKAETMTVDVKLVVKVYDASNTLLTEEHVQPKPGETVLVKLLIPAGYKMDTLEIWHIKENGGRSRIYDFWLVTESDDLYAVFEVGSFSRFVFFAEKLKEEPDVPTSGNPGDRPVTTWQPEIREPDHGTVTVSPKRAKAGGTVTITIKPDKSYVVDTLTVTDANGKTIAVAPGEDNTYTFTQPNGKATITVTFKTGEQKPGELPFTDVADADWFRDSVAYVYEHGLMNGTSGTKFSPHLDTSRGMIVAILWRMEGQPAATEPMTFTDVVEDRYCHTAVAWAAAHDIVEGYNAQTFGPDNIITREQLAAILWRYARFKEYDVSIGESTNIRSYLDHRQISEYAIPAMQWVVGEKIMSGRGGGILNPKGNAERCQVTVILHRFCENMMK